MKKKIFLIIFALFSQIAYPMEVALPEKEVAELKEAFTVHPEDPIYVKVAKQEMAEKMKGYLEMIKDERVVEMLSDPADFDPADFLREIREGFSKDVQRYKKIEDNWQKILSVIFRDPSTSMWGGINFGMSLDGMRKKINETFKTWKNEGKIISQQDFERVKDNYYLPGGNNDLTRIWGAQYLKDAFRKVKQRFTKDKIGYLSEYYDVPDFVIVTDTPDDIKVHIDMSKASPEGIWVPVVSRVYNAKIYFKEIMGKPVGKQGHPIGRSSGIGYVDFSDAGNIIEQKDTGKNYVVDTELKSFIIPRGGLRRDLLEYIAKRFKVLHFNDFEAFAYEFKLDLNN